MLQCCGNSTLELITFGATELQHLAGRWPRRSSVRIAMCILGMAQRCDAGVYWQGQGVEVGCVCVCVLVRGVCFCSWPDPPFSHERNVTNPVHKTVLADNQQLPSILRPTCLLKQPRLSLTTKMLLSLDKYLPLFFPSLNTDAADCEALQSVRQTNNCSLEVRLPSFWTSQSADD